MIAPVSGVGMPSLSNDVILGGTNALSVLSSSKIDPSSIVAGSPPSLIWACVIVKQKERKTQISAFLSQLWGRRVS